MFSLCIIGSNVVLTGKSNADVQMLWKVTIEVEKLPCPPDWRLVALPELHSAHVVVSPGVFDKCTLLTDLTGYNQGQYCGYEYLLFVAPPVVEEKGMVNILQLRPHCFTVLLSRLLEFRVKMNCWFGWGIDPLLVDFHQQRALLVLPCLHLEMLSYHLWSWLRLVPWAWTRLIEHEPPF